MRSTINIATHQINLIKTKKMLTKKTSGEVKQCSSLKILPLCHHTPLNVTPHAYKHIFKTQKLLLPCPYRQRNRGDTNN